MFQTIVSKFLSYIAAMLAVGGILNFILKDNVAACIFIGVALVVFVLAWLWESIILLTIYHNAREQKRIDTEIDKLHE